MEPVPTEREALLASVGSFEQAEARRQTLQAQLDDAYDEIERQRARSAQLREQEDELLPSVEGSTEARVPTPANVAAVKTIQLERAKLAVSLNTTIFRYNELVGRYDEAEEAVRRWVDYYQRFPAEQPVGWENPLPGGGESRRERAPAPRGEVYFDDEEGSQEAQIEQARREFGDAAAEAMREMFRKRMMEDTGDLGPEANRSEEGESSESSQGAFPMDIPPSTLTTRMQQWGPRYLDHAYETAYNRVPPQYQKIAPTYKQAFRQLARIAALFEQEHPGRRYTMSWMIENLARFDTQGHFHRNQKATEWRTTFWSVFFRALFPNLQGTMADKFMRRHAAGQGDNLEEDLAASFERELGIPHDVAHRLQESVWLWLEHEWYRYNNNPPTLEDLMEEFYIDGAPWNGWDRVFVRLRRREEERQRKKKQKADLAPPAAPTTPPRPEEPELQTLFVPAPAARSRAESREASVVLFDGGEPELELEPLVTPPKKKKTTAVVAVEEPAPPKVAELTDEERTPPMAARRPAAPAAPAGDDKGKGELSSESSAKVEPEVAIEEATRRLQSGEATFAQALAWFTTNARRALQDASMRERAREHLMRVRAEMEDAETARQLAEALERAATKERLRQEARAAAAAAEAARLAEEEERARVLEAARLAEEARQLALQKQTEAANAARAANEARQAASAEQSRLAEAERRLAEMEQRLQAMQEQHARELAAARKQAKKVKVVKTKRVTPAERDAAIAEKRERYRAQEEKIRQERAEQLAREQESEEERQRKTREAAVVRDVVAAFFDRYGTSQEQFVRYVKTSFPPNALTHVRYAYTPEVIIAEMRVYLEKNPDMTPSELQRVLPITTMVSWRQLLENSKSVRITAPLPALALPMGCAACDKPDAKMKAGCCGKLLYCSQQCANQHWATHEAACVKGAKQ